MYCTVLEHVGGVQQGAHQPANELRDAEGGHPEAALVVAEQVVPHGVDEDEGRGGGCRAALVAYGLPCRPSHHIPDLKERGGEGMGSVI